MRKCTEKEFLQILEVSNHTNFIAGAITPWHALGINATIYQLQQKKIELIGYIMIVSHPETGKAIDEKNFYLEGTKIEVLEMEPTIEYKSLWQRIKEKLQKYSFYFDKKGDNFKRIVYWATPFKPSYELLPKVSSVMKESEIKVIITDEGLADYLMTPLREWKYVMLFNKGIKKKCKACWSMVIRDPIFKRRLQKKGCLKYSQLLRGKRGAWEKNQDTLSAYAAVLRKNRSDKKKYASYSNCILINTDTMYESGILYQSVDVLIYDEICKYGKNYGIPVCLKPHPREHHIDRYSNLECCIQKENKIAQEQILASLDEMPYCIIGTGSTTLVTAHILFGVDVISINHLISKESLAEKNYFDEFNKTFSNLMRTPNNMEELMRDLDEIREKHEGN